MSPNGYAGRLHSPPASSKALKLVFLIAFLDLMGAGILLPISPFLLRQFRTDAFSVGLLALCYSTAQFITTPIIGAISDRVGRRPVLLVCIFGSAMSYFLFGLAPAVWVMFLARGLDGVTGGNISTVQAYIADVSKPEDRTKNFGLIGAAFGLGFIFGPAIGGLLSKISLQAPAIAAGVMGLITWAACYFLLPESLPPERRQSQGLSMREFHPLREIGMALRNPLLGPLLAATFLINFPFSGLQSNFAVFTNARFGWGPDQNAWNFAFIGLMVALMQGYLVGKLVKRFGERKLIWTGPLMFGAGFAWISASTAGWMMFPASGLIAFGSGMTMPTITAILSRRATPETQGALMGVIQSLASLTRVLSPPVAGLLFDTVGTGAPYWTGVIWIAAAFALLVYALRKHS